MTKYNYLREKLKQIPIEQRLSALIDIHFIVKNGGYLFMPLDEDGNDVEEAVKKNEECLRESVELKEKILKAVEKWKKDGCP